MLKIFVDNKLLTLFAETSVPSRFNHPMISEEGSHSFDVEIPAQGNGPVFGYPEKPESRIYRQRNYEARIEHSDRVFFCRCRVNSANKQTYKLNFFFEESSFFSRVKNLRIDQIQYNESFEIETPVMATAASNEETPTIEVTYVNNWDYFFKNLPIIRNPNNNFYHFYEEPMPGIVHEQLRYIIKSPTDTYPYTVTFLININCDYYPENDNHLIFSIFRQLTNLFVSRINPFIDQLFVKEITVTQETEVLFYISWNNKGLFRDTFYINNHNITVLESSPILNQPDPLLKKYSFFPTQYVAYSKKEDEPKEQFRPELSNLFNLDTGNFIWAEGDNHYHWQNAFIGKLFPQFFVKYILNKIEEITGYRFIFPEEITDMENFVIISLVGLTNQDYFKDPKEELHRKIFKPGDILPAMLISEFVLTLAKGTGTYPLISDVEKTFEFVPYKRTLLNRKAIDHSDKVSNIEFQFPSNPEGFILNYDSHPCEYFQERYPSMKDKNLLQPVNTVNDLPLPEHSVTDDVALVGNNSYYIFNGSNWVWFCPYPGMELLYNTDQENLFHYNITLYPALSQNTHVPFSTYYIRTPITAVQPINMVLNDYKDKENLPLLFSVYRGSHPVVYEGYGLYYHMLSHNLKNANDYEITGDYSSEILLTEGLYIRGLKDFLFFLTTDPVQANVRFLPTMDLIFPKGKILIDGTKYLVEQADFALYPNRISEITAILRKINN